MIRSRPVWLALVILVFTFSLAPVHGEGPEIEWTFPISTPNFDEVRDLSVLSSQVYIVGNTSGSFLENSNAGGSFDAFLGQLGSDGSLVWNRQFGTSGSDRTHGVAADSTAIYAVGSTTGQFVGQTNTGNNSDAFIRKFNPQGQGVWTRQFGTSGTDEARGVALDATGVYTVGVVEGVAAGLSTSTGSDAFIRKYDFDGNLVWSDQFGTNGSEEAVDVAVNSSGVYVVGTSTIGFPLLDFIGGSHDVFIRKYDLEGTELWTRQSGTLGQDQASGIAVGPSGVYIAGTTSGIFSRQSTSGGARDVFLISYDFEGDEKWIDQYGTEGRDESMGIAVDGSTIFVTGSTQGAFSGYTNSGNNFDAFLVSYNLRGARRSTLQIGTPGVDQSFAVAANSARVYMVGSIGGSFARESDGFVTSLSILVPSEEPITPVAPPTTPVLTPELSPSPVPTSPPAPTLTPTLAPTTPPPPAPTLAPTTLPPPAPTLAPTAAPSLSPTTPPVATVSVFATPSPDPNATPTPTTQVRNLIVVEAPPVAGPPRPLWQFVLMGLFVVLFVIALVGTIRTW